MSTTSEKMITTSDAVLTSQTSSTTPDKEHDIQAKERDLEAAPCFASETESHEDSPSKDPNLVTWDGPQDPANPKNWTNKEKWLLTLLVSLYTFISPVTSTMVAPALPKLSQDLGMHKKIEQEMALSIFVLGYVVGPLFFGPLSEVYGRVPILQSGNIVFVAFNIGCGFAKNSTQMFVLRFLAGIGGSAPTSLGGGVLGDIWSPEERGKAIGIWSLGPILGPTVGPLCAGWITERTTWRWAFWATSIAAGLIQVAGLIWLSESWASVILSKKRDRLAKETGNNNLHTGTEKKTLARTLGTAFSRPARMFATQPIVQVISLYMAYIFGLTYLVVVAFPLVWSNVYHESVGISGLNFISIGFGTILGVFINLRFVDRIYRSLKEKNGGVGRPEFRLPSMFLGSVISPIGLLWFGWSVQGHVHWIMPNIGVAIFSGGTIWCLQSMQGYLIDTYATYAASALAAAVVLRSLAGFGFPLYAPYLYESLGFGKGTTILACISIAIGIPAPFFFWVFGARLRGMSRYCAG